MIRRLLSLALLCFAAAGPLRAETVKPNIVFIFADDLGINDLSCYGRKDLRDAEPRQTGDAGHALHRRLLPRSRSARRRAPR